ncbi:MAG: putative portal protein [Prokaryotic dsDNA virus sp.]|nr:MAG: putative portal protein [Prokaryotic dsDNA virus sp.]|tara:strand:- start:18446 stop:19954 length:1509 start_codon:yes stop_codon:yes gene_type:complete
MDKNNNTKVQMIAAPAVEIESPVFKTVNNKDYIYYGLNNDYPTILKDMMNTSSLHSAILKKKSDMTAGKGFDFETVEQKTFIANINGKETLDQISYKNAYDLTLYGGFCYLVTWSKDKKSIARFQYMDWSCVRMVKELCDDSDMSKLQEEGVDFFLISSDWSQERKEKYKPKLVQGFSTEHKDETTQLVYVSMYRPGSQDTYPLPDYQASSTYIALDTEIAAWHLNSVKNGFSPSLMINMVGVPSDEEMKVFQKKLEQQYAGSANASKVILTLSEDETQIPVVTPLSLNDSDQRYKDLANQVKEQIIIGHRASSTAIGVPTAGKLGTSNEIIEAEAVFQHNVIDNYQILIQNSYTRLMNFNNIEGDLELNNSITFNLDNVEEEETDNIDEELKLIKTTFNDYPRSAINNAKRGIKLNEKSGNKCATGVGKNRAQDISNKRGLSFDTIKRTFSYLSRAEQDYDETDSNACGTISFLLWGGKSMKSWCEAKIKSIEKQIEKDAE